MGRWLILIILLAAPFLYGGFFLYERYQANPETIIPWSYQIEALESIDLDESPILLVGDRIGERFSHYLPQLSEKISEHIDNKIIIKNLSKKQMPLHRTINQLKALKKFPKILIYLGGTEEFVEEKFNLNDYNLILKNLNIYHDDRFQTLMMLYPPLSRILYHPINQLKLKSKEINPLNSKLNDDFRIKANELFFKFYELELIELITLAKENNSVLFIISPPINLNVTPQNTCDQDKKFAEEATQELLAVSKLIKSDDLKSAYSKGIEIVQKFPAHAGALFTMGQIAKKMNLAEEAEKYLTQAAAYDCNLWRANPVFRAIQMKLALKHNIYFFDFHQMLYKEGLENPTYIDDIYPQDFYFEKLSNVFGIQIKKILRL